MQELTERELEEINGGVSDCDALLVTAVLTGLGGLGVIGAGLFVGWLLAGCATQ
jgi:bacteriocin-like protein